MTTPLKILVIEDAPADFLLMERKLHQQGLDAVCRRIDSYAGLDEALHDEWDVVLADYNVPGMDFRSSLRRIQDHHSDLPVILVSGGVGEEMALELMRLGMADFILKDNLTRLSAAIGRALDSVAEHLSRLQAEQALRDNQAAAFEEQRKARIAALKLVEDTLAASARTEMAYAALHEAEAKYRLLAENSADCIYWRTPDGHFKYISPSSKIIFGHTPDEFMADSGLMIAIIHPDDRAAYLEHHAANKLNYKFELQFRIVLKDGTERWIEHHCQPTYDANGEYMGRSSSNRDVTERVNNETLLRKLSMAVDQSPESIIITNRDANIEYVNEAFINTTGYSREEIIGQNSRVLHSSNTPKITYDELWKTLTAGKTWQGEFRNKRKDGSEYSEHAIISPIRQPDGRITHFVAIKEDITKKKRDEAEIHRLAFYDTLTGLPNLILLMEHVAQLLLKSRRIDTYSALLTFNIDRFKTINDAEGQAAGDILLKAIGERLVRTLRGTDVVARIAGDEFCILLPDLAPNQQSAVHITLLVSKKIQESMLEPLQLGKSEILLTASQGIALFPGSGDDSPLDILRRANTALHHSKTKGTGQVTFFEASLDEVAKQRFIVERELHHAIKSGELRVYLQPQVDADENIVGAEALVRWQHPQRGLVPPMAFIPIAEESNLILEIGVWVFTEVCRFLTREDMASVPRRIAVNISPRHFRQPNFTEQIKRLIADTGVDPKRLTLEVTEGLVIENIKDVIAKMAELGAMGIHFSMDDFGTGYSSLSYLKRLPLNEIKIDKSFVQDITTDPNDAALVETILAVAHHLHLNVVAEGVETAEQAAFLNKRGTIIHQGYLFGRPEPLEAWIARAKK
jgi:diguanylate cyclase (GGDEF)-like protein/PAS domain S-box-containing protein